MIYYSIILVVLLVVCIYLSAWFSGTETALINLSTAQIVEMKERKELNAKYIQILKEDIDRTLVTILIGNNVVNIVLSSVSALIANILFKQIGVSVMVGVVTFLLVIFGEITPKSKAILHSKEVSQKSAKKIYILMKTFNFVIVFFLYISRKVLSWSGIKNQKVRLHISDDSIKGLVNLKEQQGTLKPIERDIINKVFRFGDKKIIDIVVPLDQVFTVKAVGKIKKVRLEVAEHGFTRVPVVDKDNKIIGTLFIKDLLGINDGPIESVIRKPFEVYSNEDITDVFDSMELRRTHIAVVKDFKTGKQIGIVTLEDILEEIVGEIHDEHTYLQEDE